MSCTVLPSRFWERCCGYSKPYIDWYSFILIFTADLHSFAELNIRRIRRQFSAHMGSLSTKPTLKEQIRENKRMIDRGIRELDRERVKLERQQVKLQGDIKKAAKDGKMVCTELCTTCLCLDL